MHRQAEDKYTNINTFAALIAQKHHPQESPLCSRLHSSFVVVAFLEHDSDTPRGRFGHLVVRAVAIWLTIAGEELVDLGSPSTKSDYISGSLWAAEGGTNTVDVKTAVLERQIPTASGTWTVFESRGCGCDK
jgi:hypothetical protein